MLGATGDGLVVDGLHWARRGFAGNGTFRQPISLAYRVQGGEITGQTSGFTVSGNILHLLTQVLAVGEERRWLGSQCLPAVVLDGVRVAPDPAGP